MMKHQLYIGMLISLMALIACQDDDNDSPGLTDNIRFTATIEGMQPEAAATRFSGGNSVGIYMVDYTAAGVSGTLKPENNRLTNVKYMQSADGLVADKPIIWGDAGKVDVYGYSPYNSVISSVEEYPFQLALNQDTLDAKGGSCYENSDFLWTSATAEPQAEHVKLTFQHLMSKIIIHLKSDAVEKGSLVGSEVRITGMNTAASINLVSGTATATDSPDTIITATAVEVPEQYEITRNVIVIPQTVPANTPFLEIRTKAGHSYTYTLSEPLAFEPGTQRTIEVALVSGECSVSIGDIVDWKSNGTEIAGTAGMIYEVGDIYDVNGVQGIIFQVDESGLHGLIFSADQGKCLWGTNASVHEDVLAAVSVDDGMLNFEAVKALDNDLSEHPAMKWCNDKNVDGITGWYLPAKNELDALRNLFQADKSFLNDRIMGSGFAGAEIIPLNPWEDAKLWSSTRYENMGEYGWLSAIDFASRSGVSLATKGKDLLVRAIHKF